jgi:hypothetical protein
MWRSFDIGAVVDSLPLRERLVVAGTHGMARPVDRARLAATPEHLRAVGANELIVTTASALAATGEASDQLMSRFDAAHIAGLAVRLDESGELPEEMLEAAEKL